MVSGKKSSKRRTLIITPIFLSIVIIAQVILLTVVGIKLSPITITLDMFMYLTVACFPLMNKFTASKLNIYLVITDEKIYFDRQIRQYESIETLNLSSLKAVKFKVKRYNIEKNIGNVEFIPDYDKPSRTSLKVTHISNFMKVQQRIESIIYEYIDVDKKWEEFKKKITFPYEFKLSSEKYRELVKKSWKFSIYYILLFTVSGLSFFSMQFIDILENRFIFTGILIVALSGLFGLPFLIGFIIMKRRNKSLNDALILYEDNIRLIVDNGLVKIPFTPTTSLDFCKLKQVNKSMNRWKELLDCITIKESYDNDNQIRFGPIENFPEVYKLIFITLLRWKKENGHLLPKSQIIDRSIEVSGSPQPTSEITPIEIIPKKSSSLEIIPKPNSDLIYKEYKVRLEPGEKIYTSFKPKLKSSKKSLIIELTIFIFSMIMFISLYFSPTETWTVVTILIQTFSGIICCFSSIFVMTSITTSYKLKDLKIIITDRKIIYDSYSDFCIVPYEKISSIIRRNKRYGRYKIEIKLIEPIPNNPYAYKLKYGIEINDNFLIDNIPQDNDLIEKLRYLISKV